jgi:hypothetical protein
MQRQSHPKRNGGPQIVIQRRYSRKLPVPLRDVTGALMLFSPPPFTLAPWKHILKPAGTSLCRVYGRGHGMRHMDCGCI